MKKILNPFIYFSDQKLMFASVLITIFGLLSGYFFNAHYDGVIDVHFTDTITLRAIVLELIIDISILSLLFYIFGKIINKQTRFIDILIVNMISRLPLYILTFSNFK